MLLPKVSSQYIPLAERDLIKIIT